VRRPITVLGVVALLGTGCTRGSNPASQSPVPLKTGSDPVVPVVQRVLPSVVDVTTDIFRLSPSGPQQGVGVGTGFIVRDDGIIVTNCHVVEGGTKITVTSSDESAKKYPARVIGGDCEHDLAVLKIDATNVPALTLGNSSGLVLGQQVVAIGYALALEGGPSVTSGIISALNRTIQAQDPQCSPSVCPNGVRTYTGAIQTDAAINHGNSGGPLVNTAGEVVGINSAGNSNAENIGFAIAIDTAKDAITQAEEHPLKASAYLGVATQDITPAVAGSLGLSVDSGALVVAVTPNGPAAGAGIAEGDVIVSVNGTSVGSSADLGDVLAGLNPGETASVGVVTPSGAKTVDVTLGTRPLPAQIGG
jgi:serine protease Do